MKKTTFLPLILILFLGVFETQSHGTPTDSSSPHNVEAQSTFHHGITTSSKEAQQAFNRGLLYYYAFNFEGADQAFLEAIQYDPECAMCYWGAALTLTGPYIKGPYFMHQNIFSLGLERAKKALELSAKTNPQEQDYSKALLEWYQSAKEKELNIRKVRFAEAMQKLSQKYATDPDIGALYANALMDVSEAEFHSDTIGNDSYSHLWTKEGLPKKYTQKIIDVLEEVLIKNPKHPGANHYLVHVIEPSPLPERALKSAERLHKNDYGIGHFEHMPAHIYMRIGNYHEAAQANYRAVELDEDYLKKNSLRGSNYEGFFVHDQLFLIDALSMEGQYHAAIKVARNLVSFVSDKSFVRLPFMNQAFFEEILARPTLVLARFEKWNELLLEPEPNIKDSYARAIWHYGRGLAYIGLNQSGNAEKEKVALQDIIHNFRKKKGAEKITLKLLEIAKYVLEGKIAEHQKKYPNMLKNYKHALKLENELPYSEPLLWYHPVSQILGSSYLKMGKYEDAEKMFRNDLKDHPKNGWSLDGLSQSLRSQGYDSLADQVANQFIEAWQWADVKLDLDKKGL